jgi:ubiquinone/menaquinone biosynthesis C-methylase UbiE
MNSLEQLPSGVRRNIAVHDRISRHYEKTHGEIFNDQEQSRLHELLRRAIDQIRTGRSPIHALDMGCGSGNLTAHLLDLGAEVTAADVSTGFLKLVEQRYSGRPVKTHQLNGRDMSELPDESFDLVATYSVLHHIPDYLAICAEMGRVCRHGGLVVIDHEASPNVWTPDARLQRFRRSASRFDWRKFMRPANYLHRLRRVFDRRYSNEGDIHVWPDDHIEWDRIVGVLRQSGCEPVIDEDYLLYRKLYRQDVWERWKDSCVDTRAMVFRRGRGISGGEG